MTLDTKPVAEADDIYAALLQAHDGLDAQASHALNARLVLLFINEVGDAHRIKEILATARALT